MLRLIFCILSCYLIAFCWAHPSRTTKSSWWKPRPGLNWDIKLTDSNDISSIVSSTDVIILDLFDTSKGTIQSLKEQHKVKVICYFSAGSYEDWRPDASVLEPFILSPMEGWEGESWLDTSSQRVRQVMNARLRQARDKGCDAVDPDNVDQSHDNPDLPGAIDYVKFLAYHAHALGLAIGLKNFLEALPQLQSTVDFAVNEQCAEFDECNLYDPFTEAGKPVFAISYGTKEECTVAQEHGLDMVLKDMSLDKEGEACPKQ